MSIKKRIEHLEETSRQRLAAGAPETWPFLWSDTGLPWSEGEEPDDLKAWCARHRQAYPHDALTHEMVTRVEVHYDL